MPYKFGQPWTPVYQDTSLANLPRPTANALAQQGAISNPKRTLGDLVHDKAVNALSHFVNRQMSERTTNALLDVTPVGAVTQGFDSGAQIRGGDWLGGGLGAALAVLPIPAPEKHLGVLADILPTPSRLNLPRTPTADELAAYGAVQSVPLDQVRRGNAFQWSRFNSGDHGQPLVQGYGDKPIAVQLENGEYVLLDGNHRAGLAKHRGKSEMPMYVIPARQYDPANAGLRPAPGPNVDDLFAALTRP